MKFNSLKNTFDELKGYIVLWFTQSLSQLGSAMTSFALTLWLYRDTGSALQTALLTICTYAPYVLMSIFAGALSDKWDKKKTMLVCDTIAALTTVTILVLYKTALLKPYHIYILNVINGLMNTVQQPASEVATTLLTPKNHYQKVSAMNSFSRSVISVLNPILATMIFSLAGLGVIIIVDLSTFILAFIVLAFVIKLPESDKNESKESVLKLAKEGLSFLKNNGLVFSMLLFMAGVNLVASCFNACLPAFVLPHPNGGEKILGLVTSSAGIAMIAGSLIAGILPKPKNRVKVVYLTMMISLGTENFILGLTQNPFLWCIAQVIGWILVPIMSANLEVVLRHSIPQDMQGRVFACRNTFQFFTIPIGYLSGGVLVDKVFEPFMAKAGSGGIGNAGVFLTKVFGNFKGSGSALLIFILGFAGILLCFINGLYMNRYKFVEDC